MSSALKRVTRWLGAQPVRLRDVGPLWTAEAVVAVCALLGVVVAARVLGTSDYGVAALALSVPQLVYSILEARGGHASVKYIARYREQGRLDRARSVALLGYVVDTAVGAVALVVSIALAPWVASGLIDDSGSWVHVAGFAVGVFFRSPITASIDTLTALERFDVVGRLRTVGAVVRLVVTVVALSISATVGSLVVGFVAGMALEAVAMVIAATRISGATLGGSVLRAGLRPLVGQRRELGRFIAYSDLSSFLRVLATQSDVVVLGMFSNTTEVGVYRLARQLTAPVVSIIVPFQSVLFARIAATYERSGLGPARDGARQSGRRIGVPLGVLILVGVPLAGPVVRLAGGSEFEAATRPTQVLLLLAVVWAFTLWVSSFLLAVGRVRALTLMSLVATVTTLVGYLVLGARYEGVGIAASRLIGQGVVGQAVGVAIAARGDVSVER